MATRGAVRSFSFSRTGPSLAAPAAAPNTERETTHKQNTVIFSGRFAPAPSSTRRRVWTMKSEEDEEIEGMSGQDGRRYFSRRVCRAAAVRRLAWPPSLLRGGGRGRGRVRQRTRTEGSEPQTLGACFDAPAPHFASRSSHTHSLDRLNIHKKSFASRNICAVARERSRFAPVPCRGARAPTIRRPRPRRS